MSRYNQQYNRGGSGSSGGSSGDYDDIPLTVTKYSTIECDEAQRVIEWTGDWGQTLVVSLSGVHVLDGVVMTRKDDPSKHKVFGWDYFGFDRDPETGELEADVSAEDAPARFTEPVAGKQYHYVFKDAVIEGRDGPDGEPVEIGDAVMFMSNSSKARRTAKTLCTPDVVVEENKDESYGWLDEDLVELNPDLEGRGLIYFLIEDTFVPDEEDADPVTYTDAVILDRATEEVIKYDNGEEDEQAESGDESASSEEDDESPSEEQEVAETAQETAQDDADEEVETFTVEELDDHLTWPQIQSLASHFDIPASKKDGMLAGLAAISADEVEEAIVELFHEEEEEEVEAEDEAETEDAAEDSDEAEVEFSETVDQLIDYFARQDTVNRENVQRLIDAEVEDSDAVDTDAVLAEIENRAGA